MLNPIIRRSIESAIEKRKAKGELYTREQLAFYYDTFREKFGPEVLKRLDGTELLEKIHGTTDYKGDSLTYWLEKKDDDEFPAIFGSIKGGDALKFGLYIASSGEWKTRKTGGFENRQVISEQQAVDIAREQRDQLLRGCELLDALAGDGTDADYSELQKRMLEVAPDIGKTAWGHKYFTLLYPDKLDDFHVPSYQRFNLIKLLQVPPEGAGLYVAAGRYVAVAKELAAPLNQLMLAQCYLGCRPYSYWRIGTTVGETNESYWELMREGNYVSIGWRELGDLSEYIKGQRPKERIKQLLNEKSYPNKPTVAGTKATEILSFISRIVIGDLVVASEGQRVLGIGQITGPYVYRGDLDFPHCRPVEWLNLDEWKIPISKGLLLTTVREVNDPTNLVEIERRISEVGGPKHYWVELTHVKGHPDREEGNYRLGAALWSPQLDKKEKTYYAYENVKKVQPGDIILHLPDGAGFSGVSVAASNADSNFVCPEGTDWAGMPGYLVFLEGYTELKEPLVRDEFLDGPVYDKLSALHDKYSGLFYYKSNHQLTSGAYLTEAPLEVVRVLNDAYKQKTGNYLPHIPPGTQDLVKDFIIAYSRVAKRVANGELSWPYVDFERETRTREEVSNRFQAFIVDPSDANLKLLWNIKCLRLARSGDTLGRFREKKDLGEIHRVFQELLAADKYDPSWEQLTVPWALRELWAKLKGDAVWGYENWLTFFGYERSRTYQDALDQFADFANVYKSALGGNQATRFSIEIEIGGLLDFVSSASSCDLDQCDSKRQFADLVDSDIQRLYSLKLQIDANQIVKVLAAEEWLRDYLDARFSNETNKWDEAYKWETLSKLQKELFGAAFSAENIIERLNILQKNNASPHAFCGWQDLDNLKKMASENPAQIAQLLNKLFARPEPLYVAINDFRDGCTKIDEQKTLGPGLFGYLFSVFDRNRYAPFNNPIYTAIKTRNEERRPITLWVSYSREFLKWNSLSAGMKYQRYCELCNEMGQCLESQNLLRDMIAGTTNIPKGVHALDGQDYFYFLRSGGANVHQNWILQSNKEVFEEQNAAGSWIIKRYAELLNVDDRIYYWKAEPDAGIYGIGHIVAQPKRSLDQPNAYNVETEVDTFYGKNIVSRAQFAADPILKESLIITQPQNTIFRLSDEGAQVINELIQVKSDEKFYAPKNLILYGPPGTGKTYKAINKALEIIYKDHCYSDGRDRKEIREEFKRLRTEHRIEFVTFHQAYSYEEFVEGIRPELDQENIKYKLNEGVFKRIAGWTRDGDPNDNFVLIIDEINRGNISKIFGELITLVEEDKRDGEDSAISTMLPYSQQPFSVPPNLYIIATMNTADRSIALMDVALRRRFMFQEFMPDSQAGGLSKYDIDGLKLGDLLTALNERITILIDRDHQIGHSFFIKVKKLADKLGKKKALCIVWHYELVPLFEEYFYNDYDKLKQLLGQYENQDGERGFVDVIGKNEIDKMVGTDEGAFSDIFVGSIHKYSDPDALIGALKHYVSKSSAAL